MKLFQYLGLCLLGLFLPFFAHSHDTPLSTKPTNHFLPLLYTIRGQTFIDNTEYFSKIMEGETIFGFHFLPGLTILMAKDITLNLGLIWERHFGHVKPWTGINPYFFIHYQHNKTNFVVGVFNLQDYPSTLLEPLHLPRKPFIEGCHFNVATGRSYLSGWLNWLTLLSKKENQPETFTFHLDGACYHGDSTNRVNYKIPLQLAVYHLGGQGILVKDYTLWCGASGIALRFPNSLGGPIDASSYLLFNSYIKKPNRPFEEGWAQLYIIDWQMSHLGMSLSYWYGRNFSSENMGHPLYQSIRIGDNQEVCHYEKIRSLLFISIYKNWMPRSGITIQATFRPYYDFKNRLLEYGFSCKLVYSIYCTHLTTGTQKI